MNHDHDAYEWEWIGRTQPTHRRCLERARCQVSTRREGPQVMTSHVDESGHQTEVSGGDDSSSARTGAAFWIPCRTTESPWPSTACKTRWDCPGSSDLLGKTFLDIGSGSGLFSLAARKMGAKVYSFDYDPISVACTVELRSKYFPDESEWIVKEGSVLDRCFLKGLDFFDVVYAYGSLHHTGDMWTALANAASLAKSGGTPSRGDIQ